MKVIIEFDPQNAHDKDILLSLFNRKDVEVVEQKQEKPVEEKKETPPKEVNKKTPQKGKPELTPKKDILDPLKKTGREVNEAANKLNDAIGEGGRMNTSERARLAAKIRWAKHRSEKKAEENKTVEKPQKKKSPEIKDDDGQQQDMSEFKEVPGDYCDLEQLGRKKVVPRSEYIPDGRDIMEGNYEGGDNWQKDLNIKEDDEIEREARRIAKSYE